VRETKIEEPAPEPLQSPKWIPYDTPNKVTLQRLYERYEQVEAGRVPFNQFIDECEKLLTADEHLRKEKPDVASIYFLCSFAAAKGKQYSLAAEYMLRNISVLGKIEPKHKVLPAIASSYLELSSAYQFANEIDKSIEAAKVVIEKYPDEVLHTKGGGLIQPTIKRYDPTTRTLTVIPDTSRKPEFVPARSVRIAGFAVSQLGRVYALSHREEEGIEYFRQLSKEYPNTEIGSAAFLEEANLHIQKRDYAEFRVLREKLTAEARNYPGSRAEMMLKQMDRIEKEAKK
jgi:tetratricopeptide (TPR) repeat protein